LFQSSTDFLEASLRELSSWDLAKRSLQSLFGSAKFGKEVLTKKSDQDQRVGKMLSTTRNCSDKFCSLNFQMVETCVILSKKPDSIACDVPCLTLDCNREFYYNVNCPIWTCVDFPTTTSTTTTPSTTSSSLTTTSYPFSTTPNPVPLSDCNSLCATAWTLSVLLAIALVIFIVLFIRNRSLTRTLQTRLSSDYRDMTETTPIIRGYDDAGFYNVPLTANVTERGYQRLAGRETEFEQETSV